MAKGSERAYDVVLVGATGFTGSLTARYLASAVNDSVEAAVASSSGEPAPAAAAHVTRWAIAGRNQQKLQALADELESDVALIHADVDDPASLRAVAESARVVVTTVGPYLTHGEPLVAACAAAGTDYVDLTGEPEFVDRVYLRYHGAAVESGARLVHCCGFDSIPHDLGTLFTVQRLPEGVPLKVEAFVRLGARFSGGTLASAVNAFARLRAAARVAGERRRAEGKPAGGRRVRGAGGLPRHVGGEIGWALPLPTIDPQIVLRSARALERYGPDFTYSHNAWVTSLPVAAGASVGLPALVLASQLAPVRNALTSRVPSGTGPSEATRAKSWFKVRFVGTVEGVGAHGERVVTEVSGGDPGYTETAKMLAESALCLAHDDLPELSGQLTTAVAMGDALRERLQRAGMRFEVVG
jgi:short subunit dehydrogenase-like uncharacterized protein